MKSDNSKIATNTTNLLRHQISRLIAVGIGTLLFLAVNSSAAQTPAANGLTYIYGTPPAKPLSLPAFSSGEQVSLSSFRGYPVVVNFWASWCPPCVKELPSLVELYQKFDSQNLKVVAINLGESAETIQSFFEDSGISLPFHVLLAETPQQINQEHWKILALPMSYVIDPEGRMVYQAVGPREFSDPAIVGLIEKLIDKEAG